MKLPLLQWVTRGRRPAPAVNEVRLLHEASAAYPELDYAALSREALALLSRRHGTDFATALFYDRVRRSREHGRFIAEVESLLVDAGSLPRLRGRVLVAPAAFYREFPEFGSDGGLVRQVAEDLGLTAGLLPVRSLGTVTQNAAILREELRGLTEDVVLVSLSKGSAEVRLALEDAAARRRVTAWVSLCGLVRGTPAADAVLSGWSAERLLLSLAGTGTPVLRDLCAGPGSLLAKPYQPPPAIPVINVVGFPLACHLGPTTRARYRRLEALGPNDGSTLLRDAILEPGYLYPVWGGDHYFRVPDASLLLYRLFLYLARQGILHADAPAVPARRMPAGASR